MTASARFNPTAAVTRERGVLQLWRYAGQPDPSVPHTYTDVPPGVADEVAYDWADASGLVPTDAFGRAGHVTRTESVEVPPSPPRARSPHDRGPPPRSPRNPTTTRSGPDGHRGADRGKAGRGAR